ncbi:LOW QUALITY PROTEIN: uncharacterized protein [Procambarus clarkii]|uniref:LOW QUALITY PROTEIN: uncharacterized protein n=1 Tax=Procambarus clarkii TaxID=6728 RepID=UPI003742A5A8
MMASTLWAILALITGVVVAGAEGAACTVEEYQCRTSGECISKEWVCDEFPDCDDKSDEPPLYDCTSTGAEDDAGSDGGDVGTQDAGGTQDAEDTQDHEDPDEQSAEVPGPDGSEGVSVEQPPVVEAEPQERCATTKCQPGRKLRLVDGRVYRYDYVTESMTRVAGSSPSVTTLTITATLALTSLTACEMQLVVEKLSVRTSKSDSGGQQEMVEDTAFTEAVTKNPLRFAYHDGEVEEVCPAPDEDPRALNFKRAVVSLLQNTMERLDLDYRAVERDVVGECQVDYVVQGAAGTSLLIHKKRHIPSCTARSSTTSFVQGVPYAFAGGLQNIPLLNSSSSCIQEIGKGLVKSASCLEEHRFTPFSTEQGGIITSITQNLTFIRQTFSQAKMGAVHGRTDLRYDHHNHIHLEGMTSGQVDDAHQWRAQTTTLLDHIADNMKREGVATNAPRLFIDLVQVLRHLNFEQLWGITQERQWGPERPVFEDALPMVGTGASVGVMRDLMVKHQVNDIITNTWLTSLSFIPRPDLDTIVEAAPLLESESVAADAFLGVGSLVHSYCRDHLSCSTDPPVRGVMDALQGFLHTGCREDTSEAKIQVLMALKGIGNAGLAVTETIPDSLAKCFFDPIIENEIRLGAITAFRRFPCHISRQPLQTLFMDSTQDSELRIAAYLELMRCADFQIVKLVKHMLLYEEVNQVGSFVWTHLQNLKETGLPSRAEVQGLLSNQDIASKFTPDIRRFSRNIEWSGFYDDLNVGGGADINMVFSQKSYIPRSATFNFTTDLFGHSLNLLEIGARAEGWDRYTDSIFRSTPSEDDSPSISNPKVLSLIEQAGKQAQYLEKDAELSLHMKTFGSEIYYRHLHGMDKIMEAINTLNPAERIRLLNQGQAINIHKSWLAAESTFIIPTTAGLPLNLSLTASVALDLHASGNVDIFSFFTTGQGGISGKLKPSVGVEVIGSMLVDGHAAQSGAQLTATLHSSTVVEGRFDVEGSENLRLDIKVPRDKIDIVNMTTSLVLVHGSPEAGSLEVVEGVTSDRMELTGCSDYQQQLGTKLCWNVQYPNASRVPESPFYPLTGPSQLQLALHKTDPTLSTYQLRYTWETRPEYRTFLLSVNTPGTATPREHSVKYNVNFRSQNIYLDLHSPKTNVSARGRYVWTNIDKRLDLSLTVNNHETATFTTGITSYSKAGRDVFNPVFTVTWLQQEIVKVTGVIDLRQKRGARVYVAEMRVNYQVPGEAGQWHPATGTINGELTDNGLEREAKLDLAYSPAVGAPEENLRIEYKETNSSTVTDIKFERNWRFFFSQFPSLNFKGQWFHRRHFGSVENNLQINLGENFEDPQHRVDVYQAFTVYLADHRTTLNSTFSVKHLRSNLDLKVGGDWFHDDHVLNTGFLVQYATNRQVESRLHMKKELSGFLDTQGFWYLKVPDNVHWEVKGHIKEKRGKIYTFEGEAKSGGSWRVEVGGAYGDFSSRLERVHNLLLDVTLPPYGLTRINATFHANERQMSLDTSVLTNSGRNYRVRVEYEHGEDHLQTRGHNLHLELHLPNQLYILNTAITFGSVVTITTELHLDRHRDIHMSVTADVLRPRQRGFQVLLKWDANRDPNQRMDLEVKYETPSDRRSSFTMSGLLFFLGQQYRANWMTLKQLEYVEEDLVWEHRNEGALSWTDTSRVVQSVTANMTLRFRRGDTAELYGKFDLTTPFMHWTKNYLEVKYFRNVDQIESTLRARWHDGEFIDLQLLAQKQIDAANFMIESKLDVSSSFEGLVSASTGVKMEKKPNIIDSNFYIQWDRDRLEISLEGKDDSFHDELRYSVFGQILTTIEGYREMSSAVDLMLRSASLDLKATSKWEGNNYKLHLNGDMYKGKEYLFASLVLSSLQQEDIVTATIRVYQDPLVMEDKLSIMVKWFGDEVMVEGQVATLPQNFKAGLHIETTLDELKRAVIVLGHSKDPVFKTEAKVQWNDKVDVGFVLLGQVMSLSDFLVSCTILTPFPGFKVITGELRNFFRLEPEVRVHSRIFGQLGEQKYGLGARYEHGQLPRLRVALEVYTPLPELHTIFLDLCDNSTVTDTSYDLTMQYGPTNTLRINLELQQSENGVEGQAITVLPLRSLDEHLSDTSLQASGSLSWMPEAKLDLTISSDASIPTKLMLKGRFPKKEEGELQLMLTTPVEGYETLDIACEYQLPDDYQAGHLTLRFSTPAGRAFHLTTVGTTKDFSGSFASPFEPFRNGTFAWKLTALDVLKSQLLTKLGWEGGDIVLDATVKFQHNFIRELDGTLETPWEDLEHSRLRLEGTPQEGGYRNRLVLEGSGHTYRGDLFWKYREENDWEVDIQVEREYGGEHGRYTVHLGLTNLHSQPLKVALRLTTPHQAFKSLKIDLLLQPSQAPYQLKIVWETPVGSGDLELVFKSFSFSKVEGNVSLKVVQEEGPDRSYAVELDLTNGSAQDMIDVVGSVDVKSNDGYWDHLVVKGRVLQVSSAPGELSLYLLWPRLEPITFKALAEHYHDHDGFRVIKPTITLDLSRSRYSFAGELRKDDRRLNLTGTLDWERGSSAPQQVVLHSSLVFKGDAIDGLLTFDLPMVQGWHTNKADIHYEAHDERHWFRTTIETGSEVTTVSGNILGQGFPAGDGVITVTSSLVWDKQPIILNFKQELTEEGYEGDYNLEWPRRHNSTSPWERSPVHASLKHRFLPSGHRGTLQITGDFTQKMPVQIDYGFKFPVTGDVTMELGATYRLFVLKVKVERLTAVLPQGIVKRRTSFEFDNALWPFGISSTTETNPKTDTELETVTTVEVFDLYDVTRRITISLLHNTAQSGTRFSIKGNVLDREVVLAMGYRLTHHNFHTSFLLSWSQDEKIEFDFDWKDVSKGFTKEHILRGKFSQPYRTVLLDGFYKRSSRNINAYITFNWDVDDSDDPSEVTGRLTWADESTTGNRLHKGLISLTHPLLQEDVKLAGELRQNARELIAADVKLEYSQGSQDDLTATLVVTKDTAHDGALVFTGTTSLLHPASNLSVETNGTVSFGSARYGLEQDLSYTNLTGHQHTAHLLTTLHPLQKTLHISLETWRKLVDIEMEVEQDNQGRWKVATTSSPGQAPLLTYLQVHPAHPVLTITFDNLLSNDTTYDTSFPRYIAEQVVIEGGIEDHRNARFSMKHLQPAWLRGEAAEVSEWISDANFFFRLNHSRLLTSRLSWRPEMKLELMNEVAEVIGASHDLRQNLEDWVMGSLEVAADEVLIRAQPILKDLVRVVRPLLLDFRNESREFVADLWLLYNNINSTAMELQILESVRFVVSSVMVTLEEIPAVQRLKARLESGVLRGALKTILDKLRGFYLQLFLEPSGPGLKEKLSSLLSTFAEMHDQMAKRLYLWMSKAVQGFTDRVGEWLRRKWRAVYDNYKPHILRTFDDVETNAWIFAENLIEWLQKLGLEIKSSATYRRIQEMVEYLEDIYRDFTENSKRENLEKYYNMMVEMVKNGVRVLMMRVAPFVEDWVGELRKAWEQLLQYRPVRQLQLTLLAAADKVLWTVRYVDVRGHVVDALVFTLEHGYTIVSQTSVQASQKHILAKTKFSFIPEEGEMELVQKLPIDWHSFDHKPNWRDLPEYKNIQWVRDTFFSSMNFTFHEVWYKYLNLDLSLKPISWILPSPATGYMIGEQHFMTFDGRHLEFKGRCQHLLAADMVGGRWAVTVNYHSHSSRTIIIYIDNSEIELASEFRVTINRRPTELPAGLPSATVHRWLNKIHVYTDYEFSVTWNQAHDVVAVSVYGLYFNKTGGLLGVYNNEPYDDFQLPDGTLAPVVGVLAEGWDVSRRQCLSSGNIARGRSKVPIGACTFLFQANISPFKHCFFQVDPRPYLDMCLVDYRGQERDTCTAATAYTEACSTKSIPVKIPVFCVQCEYMTNDGQTKTLEEGTSVMLERDEILRSTDVVLLVEARACNLALAEKKPLNRFDAFIHVMNEELETNGFRLVRYAMVVYGSDSGMFTQPTVSTVDNQIFVDAANIHRALDHVVFLNETDEAYGYLSPDAFDAFTVAAKLNFRAGVTITFVHFPCESCLPAVPSMDYSTMYHILLEYSINLHVFNQELFDIPKEKEKKKILGIDSSNAYTLKDAKNRGRAVVLKGDPVIRRQVTIPKDKLGFCAPLALETNGTIFTFSSFMIPKRRSPGKEKKKVIKLATVFGQRVALTALPQERKRCVCVPTTPDGAASVHCDNWNNGHISILEQYAAEELPANPETNIGEEGSCIRRDPAGKCVEWLKY